MIAARIEYSFKSCRWWNKYENRCGLWEIWGSAKCSHSSELTGNSRADARCGWCCRFWGAFGCIVCVFNLYSVRHFLRSFELSAESNWSDRSFENICVWAVRRLTDWFELIWFGWIKMSSLLFLLLCWIFSVLSFDKLDFLRIKCPPFLYFLYIYVERFWSRPLYITIQKNSQPLTRSGRIFCGSVFTLCWEEWSL